VLHLVLAVLLLVPMQRPLLLLAPAVLALQHLQMLLVGLAAAAVPCLHQG
jgi:hypothetical protein